jgi:hypothetical protein
MTLDNNLTFDDKRVRFAVHVRVEEIAPLKPFFVPKVKNSIQFNAHAIYLVQFKV